MAKTLSRVVDILASEATQSIKLSFLSGFIPKNKRFTALTALAIGSKVNKKDFQRLSSKLSVYQKEVTPITIAHQCLTVLRDPKKHHRISLQAYLLLQYCLHPANLGFTKPKLMSLMSLSDNPMTPQEAADYLNVPLETFGYKDEGTLSKCLCCNRKLERLATEKLCKTCVKQLEAFAAYRSLPFTVRSSSANFMAYKPPEGSIDPSTEIPLGSTSRYMFSYIDGYVKVDYSTPAGLYQPELPFAEYRAIIY